MRRTHSSALDPAAKLTTLFVACAVCCGATGCDSGPDPVTQEGALTVVTDAMPTPTLDDLAAGVAYQIGPYVYEAELTDGEGSPSLAITVAPFQSYQVDKWQLARYLYLLDEADREAADELKKSWWSRDVETIFDDSPAFQDSVENHSLSLELRTDDLAGFGHLYMLKGVVRHVVLRLFVKPFLDGYRSELEHAYETLPVGEAEWMDVVSFPPRSESIEQAGKSFLGRFLSFEDYASGSYYQSYFDRLFAGETLPHFELERALPPLERHPLVVVHGSSNFDEERTAKAGLDELVERFEAEELPVVFLVDRTGDYNWYTEQLEPTHAYFSAGGEHDLLLSGTQEVTVVGGFFGMDYGVHGCQHRAWLDFIYNHFEIAQGPSPLTINMVLPAMYFYEDWDFSATDIDAFRNLHESYHMLDESELDQLPFSVFGGNMARNAYDYQYYADGELTEEYDNGTGKQVRIKFWSSLPGDFPAAN